MTRPSDALAAHRAELIEMLKENGVESAVIFGSTANGTDSELSDLDIAVSFQVPPRGLAYYGALVDLEEKAAQIVRVPVDMVGFNVAQISNGTRVVRVLI